jgi:hypothetical protein
MQTALSHGGKEEWILKCFNLSVIKVSKKVSFSINERQRFRM